MKNVPAFKDPCFYCKRDMRKVKKTYDHVIPVSKGGQNKNNIVRCCPDCNVFKSNKGLEAWLNEVKSLVCNNTPYKALTVGDLGNIISGIKKLLRTSDKPKKSRVKEALLQQLTKLNV